MTTWAEQHYNIKPDLVADLRLDAIPANPPAVSKHRHVVVILPNGTEVWLDISIDHDDHDFIDIRQFNLGGKMKGQGVFTIVNGARQSLGEASIEDGTEIVNNVNDRARTKWTTHKEPPLPDTTGTPVTGHGWNGGYVVTLLVDKNDAEKAAIEPSQGNG